MATKTPPPLMGLARFERFFREAASLDVDKADIQRFEEFIDHKLHDLLIMAQATAKWNVRDVIQPQDLPITKGLQERMQEYDRLKQEIGVEPIIERLAVLPRLDLAASVETEQELPRVAGGLAVALAHAFKILDTDLKNPQTVHWERATRLFDQLM